MRGVVVAACLLSLARTAAAEPAVAEALFEEAQRLVEQGEYAKACPKFAESQRLDPQRGTLLNLADCHEHQGRIATAWSEYKQLADIATLAHDDERAEYANKRIAELAPKVGRVSFHVIGDIETLRLDGEVLGRAAWETHLPLDAGEHVVEGMGKATSVRRSFSSNDGANVEVEIVLPKPPLPPPPPPRTNPWKTAGWIGTVTGSLAIATGLVFGGTALGWKGTVDSHCDPMGACDPRGLEAVDQTRGFALASTIFITAGAIVLAGGITAVIFGKTKADR